jgi:hypothetical protein
VRKVVKTFLVFTTSLVLGTLISLGFFTHDLQSCRPLNNGDARMFTDPQSVTINAVANSLPRISSGTLSGAFQKDDGLVKLSISHQVGKRSRHFIRLDHSKIAADPLTAGVNVKASMSVWMVCDVPETGYTQAEQKQIVDALTAYLTASSGARVTQLLGNES